MKLVVDANVIISALVSDSKSRELIVTLEPELLTPEIVHDEIGRHRELIVEKSGMDDDRVEQFLGLLFRYIETVPVADFHGEIDKAEEAIADIDPDDVLYVACALACEAAIWSDDSDFEEQSLVEVYPTVQVVEAFSTG